MLMTVAVTAALAVAPLVAQSSASTDNWPSFRGPQASGVAEDSPVPTRWSVSENLNIQWKTPIPGLAHSSPIIWGDQLFVASAVKEGDAALKVGLYGSGDSVEDEGEHEFRLYCLDRNTGDVTWERLLYKGVPVVKRHPKASHANSTPATNGTYVVVFFGSEGLYCLTMDGDLAWKKDLGVLDAGAPGMRNYQWGFASSPIIHDGRVFVQCDVQDQSFVASFDIETGEELWRTDRDEDPTWATPAVDVRDGRSQVICNGYKHIGGYDLETGEELWRMHGGGDVPVPTPVIAHDLIFITSAHGRQAPVYAIKPHVSGEITADPADGHMAWSTDKLGNYMQTPLIYGDELYCCRDNGVLTCYDARTGEMHYRERLSGGRDGFSASAVAANGYVIITSEQGEIYVVKAGTTFEVLNVNDMGEICMASPAISGGRIYYRTRGHVVAIAETTDTSDH